VHQWAAGPHEYSSNDAIAFYRRSVVGKGGFSSTSAPASNIRASQSASFNAGLCLNKRRRRYSTGTGVLGAIIVTLIAGAGGGEVAIERAQSVALRTRHRVLLFASRPP
jgi:hypothetical protein